MQDRESARLAAVRGFPSRAAGVLLLLMVVGLVGGAPGAVAGEGPSEICPSQAGGSSTEGWVESMCVDPLATADSEAVTSVDQPLTSDPPPGFDTLTGQWGGSFGQNADKTRMSPAAAFGGGHLYVVTDNAAAPYGPGVYKYSVDDGCASGDGKPLGTLCRVYQADTSEGAPPWQPSGIAYYRGEVFVSLPVGQIVRGELVNAGDDGPPAPLGLSGRVYVFDSGLGLQRRLVTPGLRGLDAAWGELWGRVKDVGVFQSRVGMTVDYLAVVDPQSGALRGAAPLSLAPYPDSPDPQNGSTVPLYPTGCPSTGGCPGMAMAKDVAISPEINVVSSGNFSIRRLFAQSALVADPTVWTDVPVPNNFGSALAGDPGCWNTEEYAGPDAPVGAVAAAGMKWLIQVDDWCYVNANYTKAATVAEYPLSSQRGSLAGTPDIGVHRTLRRTWRPQDYTTDTVRDIAYQAHEPRIVWTGNPTRSNWQHGNQPLTYWVTDGDYFIVANKLEHWFDPANGFQNVVLTATPTDAQGQPNGSPITLASSDQWMGTLTINEDTQLPSGTYKLTMDATIGGGKHVTKTNPNFHVDHTIPSGTLDSLPAATNAPVDATGTIADTHAGPATWTLEVNGPGTGGWQPACPSATAPDAASGKWGCRWNTPAYQEGTYQVRAALADQVQPAYGGANTLPVGSGTVIVDRTAPALGNFAPSLDQATYEAVDRNPEPVQWTQSDAGSGISGTTIEVNAATDGSASGSWQQIGSSSTAGETEFNWNSNTVASGLHRFRATSTDRAGNQARPEWQAILSNARPNAPDACPSCARWYAGVNAGIGSRFYSWGVKGQLKTPSEAPVVEAPVRYAGETRSTYQASSTWVGVGYPGRHAGWYQGGLVTKESCASDPQPGSPGAWYRYFEWKQGGTRTNRIYHFQCYARDQASPAGALNTFKVTLDSGHRAKGYLNSHLEHFDGDNRPRGYWVDKYGHRQTIATGETTRDGRLMLGFMSLLGWRQTATTSTWTPFNAGNYVFDDASNDTYTIESTPSDDRFCVAGPTPKTCTP